MAASYYRHKDGRKKLAKAQAFNIAQRYLECNYADSTAAQDDLLERYRTQIEQCRAKAADAATARATVKP